MLLLKSPVGLIYAFSALLVLLAIWQVSQVKADIGNNGRPINNDPKQKKQQYLYWLKRLGLFMVIAIIAVLAESVWWTKSIKIQSTDADNNKITRNLPLKLRL